MASIRNNPAEWENAVNELKNYPAEFPGMGDLIFPCLKFSYDHLSSETHRKCFLFCALFLKNQLIRKDEHIDLWIGEGLLRDSHNIAVARLQGESIIDSLIRVCLLEEVQTYFGNYVKMHDMLRDLALWIASQDKGNKILASKPENGKLIIDQQSVTWNKAVRVSLCSFAVTSLVPRPLSLRRFFKKSPTPAPPSCPRLLTLLVRYASMKGLPEWFFQSMPALRVLEWSRNGDLTKLPMQKGELINLRYLNLSDTDISQLPIEIKRCCQLIILLLDGTEKLKAIPKGLLSELSALQVFSRVPTHYDSHEDKSSGLGVNVSLLEELESLKHMQDASVVLSTLDSVEKFQSSSKLQSCIRSLIIENPSSTSSITKMLHDADFRNLQDLFISNCFPNI
ncbi:Disease resistance protein SUMM2 [Citrus sinensis]|uniref:Disease resistance protein SUMM2 n=1 Tax=Citrus sinensis TaxID=2711 RepID=A0ACB8JK24_CITSI|nr:Disease resistance protein SUMM2 [Citrus sinensis]